MRKIELQGKLLNHIMQNGNKSTGEKLLLNSFKNLQQDCNKRTKEIFKLAIINTTPVFKIHTIKNKKMKKKKRKVKEIPVFITNQQLRSSLALKLILKTLKKSPSFFSSFTSEILLSSQSKSNSIELKDLIQKQVLNQKKYFRFFRWVS
jgi:ribosomal protein S7|uniref:Ribosomal protein S7 n=1 Tax=Didymosphenia geminata TaxID=1115533 RepID=A0A1L4BMD2_9STRA|nr:ribosomal protein S7 [Didymosphenia geminata]API83115.1 ribosomal protein S7 [Didymosphenia geminata]